MVTLSSGEGDAVRSGRSGIKLRFHIPPLSSKRPRRATAADIVEPKARAAETEGCRVRKAGSCGRQLPVASNTRHRAERPHKQGGVMRSANASSDTPVIEAERGPQDKLVHGQ